MVSGDVLFWNVSAHRPIIGAGVPAGQWWVALLGFSVEPGKPCARYYGDQINILVDNKQSVERLKTHAGSFPQGCRVSKDDAVAPALAVSASLVLSTVIPARHYAWPGLRPI